MARDLWPYIGSLGRLIPVPSTASESVSAEERYVVEATIEGRRRAQVRPAAPRTWSVDIPFALGPRLAALEAFAYGAWGNGPWQWIPVQAQTGNLLTPRESVLLDRASVSESNVQDAGPMRDANGAWSPRSVTVTLDSGWVALVRGVPVVPGLPFTFSCDVDGVGPQVQIAFHDGAGGQISTHSAAGTGSGVQRVSLTALAPAGAVEAYVGVRSTVTRATRPQATWTPGPVAWASGHGCAEAIVTGLSSALTVVRTSGNLGTASFTVMEVA